MGLSTVKPSEELANIETLATKGDLQIAAQRVLTTRLGHADYDTAAATGMLEDFGEAQAKPVTAYERLAGARLG